MYPPLLAIATSYRVWEEGTQSTVTNQQAIARCLRNQELEALGASGNTAVPPQWETSAC